MCFLSQFCGVPRSLALLLHLHIARMKLPHSFIQIHYTVPNTIQGKQ